jgi:hypothetical protein
LRGLKRKGVVVRAGDGSHWGPQGHRIAGEALAREINSLIDDENGNKGDYRVQ